MKKKITIGILAHVDAGKTTLSEALLYASGRIRTLGRVDHKSISNHEKTENIKWLKRQLSEYSFFLQRSSYPTASAIIWHN